MPAGGFHRRKRAAPAAGFHRCRCTEHGLEHGINPKRHALRQDGAVVAAHKGGKAADDLSLVCGIDPFAQITNYPVYASIDEALQAESFEVICGPVNKNFVARITLTQYRGAPASNATKISVSKNNGPFAIKASGQSSASYTINF